MTETASRPGTTPAVATLTAPDTEGVALTDSTPTPPTWAWPLSAPTSQPPEGEMEHGDGDEERVIDGSPIPPPLETLEPDPTEVTVVASITTPEKAMPKVTSFGPPGKRR